jgi:hypothetical protein
VIAELTREDKMELAKFVCAFVWADMVVKDEERRFVVTLCRKMGLQGPDLKQVERWLRQPPSADELDPNRVPLQHRELFLETVRNVAAADGEVHDDEKEMIRLFEEMMHPKG